MCNMFATSSVAVSQSYLSKNSAHATITVSLFVHTMVSVVLVSKDLLMQHFSKTNVTNCFANSAKHET